MDIKKFIIKVFKIDVKPVIVNTISVVDFENTNFGERASGRTTRLADMYIQLLFSTGRIKVSDHHTSRLMSQHLTDIIARRLEREHKYIHYNINRDVITLDKYDLEKF